MKVIAIILGVLVIWVMWPHVRRGEFIAPNPIPPGTWIAQYGGEYGQALASPPQGYGFRRFDFWNNPPVSGRPVTHDDFQLRY